MLRFTCAACALLVFAYLDEQCRAADVTQACRIEIVEQDSHWPVPLVELRTVSGLRLVSDNAGLIACDQPELLDRETYFHVQGQGYEVAKDGFGFQGVRLTPRAGATLRVEVTRRILAKRIGRLTGSGLFAESQKLGEAASQEESGVVGCDSVQNAVHRGKLFWIWGDTNVARYPLGIFQASGATTAATPLAAFKPPLNMPLDYFRDDTGRPRAVAEVPGRGPTWLSGLASLPDAQGQPHLVATYVKVAPPLDIWQRGLAEWNEESQRFEVHRVLWSKEMGEQDQPQFPDGHTAIWKDEAGVEWLLFGNPLPNLRCRATYEAWSDSTAYEPLTPQATIPTRDGQSQVKPHSGSIAWNAYRQRWVTVFMETFGKPSAFGELWYAEAASPLGPWESPVKILSHDNYTFYNPRIHPEFTPDGSPMLFFEGTYTTMFVSPTRTNSLSPDQVQPTPRYDYNQILYRLDLDEPAFHTE